MINLPVPVNKSRIRHFWTSFSIVITLILSIACILIHPSSAVPVGLVLIAVLLSIGFIQPVAGRGYEIWNKLSIRFSRYATAWLSLSVLLVLYIVGLAGSKLQKRHPVNETSMWMLKDSTDLIQEATGESKRGEWLGAYMNWVRTSKNWWAIILLPPLILINLINTEEYTASVPRNTYTLY
jgi:hypothetical protein